MITIIRVTAILRFILYDRIRDTGNLSVGLVNAMILGYKVFMTRVQWEGFDAWQTTMLDFHSSLVEFRFFEGAVYNLKFYAYKAGVY